MQDVFHSGPGFPVFLVLRQLTRLMVFSASRARSSFRMRHLRLVLPVDQAEVESCLRSSSNRRLQSGSMTVGVIVAVVLATEEASLFFL
jgi:hypothetical protein